MGEIHELSFWPFLWFGLPGRLLIFGLWVNPDVTPSNGLTYYLTPPCATLRALHAHTPEMRDASICMMHVTGLDSANLPDATLQERLGEG